MHVLIIEDEPLLAWDLADTLGELGYTSVTIERTEWAAVASRRHWPDLITADYNLVQGTGVGAVRTICAERSTPVLFITGEPQSVLKLFSSAIVIGKPWSFTSLSEGIRRCRRQS